MRYERLVVGVAFLVLALLAWQPMRASADLPAMPEAVIFNTAVLTGADILPADINVPGNYDSVAMRITLCLSASSAAITVQVDNGTTTEPLRLVGNGAGGVATAGDLHTFVIGVSRTDDGTSSGNVIGYNFTPSAGTTVDYLLVEFIRDGTN